MTNLLYLKDTTLNQILNTMIQKQVTFALCYLRMSISGLFLPFVFVIFYTLTMVIIVRKIILTFVQVEIRQRPVPTAIDKSVSDAIKVSKKVSMKRNICCVKKTQRRLIQLQNVTMNMVKCPHRHVFGLKTAVLFRSLVSLT